VTSLPVRLGPFEVGAKIGGGGMASVYVGRRVSGEPADEIVALKLIRDDLADDKKYVTMFLDEAKILSRLSHPDIIRTRDYGVDGDTRYIAMELLLGRSLLDAFERAGEVGKRMPHDLAAFVALRVAEALHYAHALTSESGQPLHVIHRDVNPTNVFVTYGGTVKLIDFGLAKSAARLSESGEGVVKGKVPYLSPEQIEEKPFDHRTDLYTLGATLWEMTTGRRLFKRDNDVETIRAIRDHDIPDARKIVESYPDALWSIVEHALARDPDHRYESGGAMAADLSKFLEEHGRKGDLEAELAAWIEELFPGERAKQEAWLEEVSAVGRESPPSTRTMAPPAPVAEVPSKSALPNDEEEEEKEAPAAPQTKERHPVAALLAAGATVLFFIVLALVFSRC
jgi:serine/threonine-protein kinase